MAEKQSTAAQVKDQYVTTILVTHNGVTWLSEVVASLSSQKHLPDQIIAVDNGSTDGSVKLLSNAGIPVIKQSKTAGFGLAVATAVSKLPLAEDENNEWLWIIHDDCAPDKFALAKLLEAVVERPQVAIAGPKILGWYDRKHILEAGVSITENGTRWTGLEEREHDQGQHDDVNTVLAVSSAGMLIKRSVFEELGGFDPSLELFRDDVDLGWRANIAGYGVICVGQAVLYHAEAASTERRTVDVKDAILHRPLLLDRRNAAFVLLANSSWWILPWVALQLLLTSLGRSIIYLLAKLPGYAADEIAAIGLLIFKPADLIKSRRYRKRNRVLTARVIKQFIPPRTIQLRATIERISTAVTNAFKPGRSSSNSQKVKSYSDIGVIDESFDEIEFVESKSFSKIRALAKQPFLFGLLIISIFTILYSRNRFGSLSGGALPVAPDSAMHLVRDFVSSWHLVGLGSSSPAPLWMLLLAGASLITAGNPQIFIYLFFLLIPFTLFSLAYRSARKYSLTTYSATFVGLIYAISPVALSAINQGRVGTLVVAILVPIIFTSLNQHKLLSTLKWRKLYLVSILAAVGATFSPAFLLFWFYYHLFQLVMFYASLKRSKSYKWQVILKNFDQEEIKKRAALLITPILINLPISLSILANPISKLLEPGLPISAGDPISILLFNPGGPASPALFIFAPFILYLIIALITKDQRDRGLLALVVLVLSITLSSYFVSTNNGSAQRIWTGSLLVFAQFILLLAVFAIGERLLPQLRKIDLGYKHFISMFTAIITILSVSSMAGWALTTGANSLVRTDNEQVIPAFISDLATTDEKPKTLVIRKYQEQIKYFVTRGSDLIIGEPDVSSQTPEIVHKSVVDLFNGIGANSSQVLGYYGIQYIFMKNPADPALVRTIDGIGGFTRSSATKDGVIWKVNKAHARVSFQNKAGQFFTINSTDKSANGYISSVGVVIVAEKYDPSWKLLLNGKNVTLEKNEFDLPIFRINQPGEVLITHDGTARRGWISIQLIIILSVVILALPAGRRRREVPLEELL
ncbi:MAG: glycosyltransferase family 2 protein [Actinobacteria bacterium]|nr:glycosyltransferase family 2 protein [Actinomycetota bacterium]